MEAVRDHIATSVTMDHHSRSQCRPRLDLSHRECREDCKKAGDEDDCLPIHPHGVYWSTSTSEKMGEWLYNTYAVTIATRGDEVGSP